MNVKETTCFEKLEKLSESEVINETPKGTRHMESGKAETSFAEPYYF